MTRKSLTDKHGDVITISDGGLTLAPRGHVVVHVKESTPGRVYFAAAYADPADLRAALDEVAPAGSYTRTDEDSGVAAEALTGSTLAAHFRDKRDMERARAEKVEQERDDWKRRAGTSAATSSRLSSELVDARARAVKAEKALAWMTAHRDQCRDTAIKWQMEANRAEQARALTPDDISEAEWDQIAARAWEYWENHTVLNSHGLKRMMQAALTGPTRPEGAAELQLDLAAFEDTDQPHTDKARADYLAALGWTKEQP